MAGGAAAAESVQPFTLAYRRDGWPFCPQCGEDELASDRAAETRKIDGVLSCREPKPTDPMTCLRCGWRGCLPTRSEAVRSGAYTWNRDHGGR